MFFYYRIWKSSKNQKDRRLPFLNISSSSRVKQFNPMSTGLFYLVVALGGGGGGEGFHPSIKFAPDILEHWNLEGW